MASKRRRRRVQVARKHAEWFLVPPLPAPKREPCTEPERDEAEVRIACELVLLFALMHRERGPRWWLDCQSMAFTRPTGSWSYVFFWSMRILGSGEEDLASFRRYLDWKWSEYESGRLRREGPRWA